MSSYIIPLMVSFILVYGMYKRVNIYDVFINGVIEGLRTCLKIFPTIFSMIISINVLLSSNIIYDIANIFNINKYPSELITLSILRPVSSSSSLIVLNDIFSKYGVDSLVGRIASVIQGSTDTTIYIIGLYYSSVGIKKIKYSLIVGLLADVACIIISVILCNIY